MAGVAGWVSVVGYDEFFAALVDLATASEADNTSGASSLFGGPVACAAYSFCGPARASRVCERRKKPFSTNTCAWRRLCAQLFVSAELVHFRRERQ